MRNLADKPNPRGLWIAVFGPDGAGKSAVIDQLSGQLEASFAGVTRFHFRPMFRRQGGDDPAVTAPHSKPPRSGWASVCKLIYWFLDCWLGYLLTIRRKVASSQIVIFDRYLPDILVDPLRYRLPAGSLRFAQMLVAQAPHPDLCILLDVPADVIQQRKQEVPLAESQRQRTSYLAMFAALPNTLLVDASSSVDEVVQQIITAILAYLTNSSSPTLEAYLLANL
jgi:thymidylate kinase